LIRECNRDLINNKEEDIPFLNRFSQITFKFISSLFKDGWDTLKMDINNKTLHELIKDKFSTKILTLSKERKSNKFSPLKPIKFTKLPPSQLFPRPSKKVLEKSKFHGENAPGKQKKPAVTSKPSYVQVLSKNVNNILKIKKNFSNLSNKKIKELIKSIFNNGGKSKPRISMMTKGPSHKQVIVTMNSENSKKFIS